MALRTNDQAVPGEGPAGPDSVIARMTNVRRKGRGRLFEQPVADVATNVERNRVRHRLRAVGDKAHAHSGVPSIYDRSK